MVSLYVDLKEKERSQIRALRAEEQEAKQKYEDAKAAMNAAYPSWDVFYTPKNPSQEYLAMERLREYCAALYQQRKYLEKECGIRQCYFAMTEHSKDGTEVWMAWDIERCPVCRNSSHLPSFTRN